MSEGGSEECVDLLARFPNEFSCIENPFVLFLLKQIMGEGNCIFICV